MAELKCLAALYSKPPGWFLSDLSHELCEQPPVDATPDLQSLASLANAVRTEGRTTSIRQEDVDALETIVSLSGYTFGKLMWLGDVHFLHSTALIPLVFQSGTIKQDLLAALQRQSSQSSGAALMAHEGIIAAKVVEVHIEFCQAQGDYLKFGGRMILRFDGLAKAPPTDRKFEARMSRSRDIEISLVNSVNYFSRLATIIFPDPQGGHCRWGRPA